MDNVRFELADCENTLLFEIGCRESTRKDVSLTYALTLLSSERTRVNWKKVNEAIIARWSWHALHWIKRRAWKLAEEAS